MKKFLIKEYGEKISFSESHCKNKSSIVIKVDVSLKLLIEIERIKKLNDIDNKIKDVTKVLKSEIFKSLPDASIACI